MVHKERAPRLADVAAAAGVSLATASRSLRGLERVSPGVAARVVATAETLGFVANAHARTLAGGTTSTVGLVIHQIDDPYFTEIAAGVIGAAEEHDYGALLAADYGLSVTLAACSGAQTADVVRDQLTILSASTHYVTMTIGGNDVGFSSALTICALPGWLGNCRREVDAGLAALRRDLPDLLDQLLGSIRSRAPRARVVVAGYPHLFHGTDCNGGRFFSRNDEDRINQVTDELDALIENRTEAAGLARTDGSTSAAAINCSTSLPTRARPPTWPRTNRGGWQPCVSDTRRGGLDHALHQTQCGSLPSDQDSRIARFNRKFR